MTDSQLILITESSQKPLIEVLRALSCHFRATCEIRRGCSALYPDRYWKTFGDRDCTASLQPVPLPVCCTGEKFILISSKNLSYLSLFLLSVIPCHAWLWRAWLPPLSPPPLATWVAVRCLWNCLCTRLDVSHCPSQGNAPALIILMASAELAPVCWCLCWIGVTKVYAVL